MNPPWDKQMAEGIAKWINRFNAIKGEPPTDMEDIFHLNMALLMIVATSMVRNVEEDDLVLMDKMSRAALKAMLAEIRLRDEKDQRQTQEAAGGSEGVA